MCPANRSIITKPSRTAPGEPGRFIISEEPFVPVNPRVKSDVGTFSLECARSTSEKPGIAFSINGALRLLII